jgi:hypothetical protein
MPSALNSGDRKLLIGAGCVLVLLLVASTALSPAQNGGTSSYPSSYSTSWDGAKGAFLLLQDLGYRVQRWEKSPSDIDAETPNQVLILAEPVQGATGGEKSAIREFLERGGRVLAVGDGAARVLPEASAFTEGQPLQDKTKFPPVSLSPLVRGASEISMIAPEHWEPPASQVVAYGNGETAAVVTYTVGKGQVIWWGASTPMTNGGIRDSNNLELFLNSIGPKKDVHVLWDEYFHGTHGTLMDYFSRTPVPWGVVQLSIVFLAVMATYSRRQGPVAVPARVSRLSPLEFVETLGDLYSSAHAGDAAVRIAERSLRFKLARQLGTPANISASDLAHSAAQSLSWNEADFKDLLQRCEAAMQKPKLPDTESLKIVQEIFEYSSRLDIRSARKKEGQPE